MPTLDDPVLDVAYRVGDRHLLVVAHDGREPLLGRGELDEVERIAVLVEPGHRRADTELDAGHRVGLVTDRGLLAPAEVLVRTAQDLDEQLFLAREVPVEDTLADVQARRRCRPPTWGGSPARRRAAPPRGAAGRDGRGHAASASGASLHATGALTERSIFSGRSGLHARASRPFRRSAPAEGHAVHRGGPNGMSLFRRSSAVVRAPVTQATAPRNPCRAR